MLTQTPDITPAQILMGLQWVVSQIIAFGWLHNAPSQVALSIASTALAMGIAWAEAHIRHGRAIVRAAEETGHAAVQAAAAAKSSTPTGP